MKFKKFTFKKNVATGRYKSFELKHTDIKMGGKIVGYISESREGTYTISFAIKKEKTLKEPADFKWIHLKKKFINENEARAIIKLYEEALQIRYDLYQFKN